MTLTARVMSFFLAVLACLLVGFVAGLWLLADRYLRADAEQRLSGGLGALVAAADVSAEGVEWEPESRALNFGRDAATAGLRWIVENDRGRIVDRSPRLPEEVAQALAAPRGALDSSDRVIAGEPWLVNHKTIASPEPARPQPAAEGSAKIYRGLSITAGISLAPAAATLRNLLFAAAGLSIGLWCLAALAGRWVCRRALAPVRRMAAGAQAMNADDWQTRLPAPAANDELAELARAFNDLLDRLEDSFERQRRFTGDASHQLRSPLAAMLGQLDVALLRKRSADDYVQSLETVQAQAQRLQGIVEALLFLSRGDAESLRPEFHEIELAAWLAEHLQLWSSHPRWADIELLGAAADQAIVRTHPQLLAQLVDNLLDNAAKYSRPGTTIAVRLAVADGNVECSIVDRGIGISDQDRANVFNAFFRSAEARRLGIGGAGLGLSVAKRIAAILGMSLEVESVAGSGSRFVIRLPLAKDSQALAASAAGGEAASS